MSYLNDKWVLSSCLQKSIRRGLVEYAKNYFLKIYEQDSSYAKYRLSLILTEDIGIANLKVLKKFSEIYLSLNAPKESWINLIEEIALGVKDRTASNLSILQKFDLEKIDKNRDLNYIKLLKEESKFISNEVVGTECVINYPFHYLSLPESELNIILWFKSIHRDINYSFLPYLLILLRQNIQDGYRFGKKSAGNSISVDFETIIKSDIIIESLDWHTQIGKSVIHKFAEKELETTRYIRAFIPSLSMVASIIGSLFFILEGQKTNNNLLYEPSVELFNLTPMLFSPEVNDPSFNINEALFLFKRDIVVLNEMLIRQIS